MGREDVGKDEKEAFIKALVKFKVGWDKFYGYRAYFLAAAGIAEFKECRLGDEIVRQTVTWEFGYFNKQKQNWRTFLYPIAEIAREVLKETDRKRAIYALVELICNSGDEYTRCVAAYSLGKLDKHNSVAIAALVELIRKSRPEDTVYDPADCLGEIMTSKHFATAVSGLKKCLTSEIYKNNFGRNEKCYGVIWNCAENMTYPDFYQAWHA